MLEVIFIAWAVLAAGLAVLAVVLDFSDIFRG